MATGKKTGGRQPGSTNKKTKAIQAAVAATGLTPLQIMLWNTREHHATALTLKRRAAATKDEGRKAALQDQQYAAMERSQLAAKQAADFIHPKLQSVINPSDPEASTVKVEHTVSRETMAIAFEFIHGKQLALPAPVKRG